jgi:hypothetical protein
VGGAEHLFLVGQQFEVPAQRALACVPGGDAHPGEPGSFEVGRRLGGDFRVDVDGGDVPA